MAIKFEHYFKREHTYIKHLFLTKYLQEAALKIWQKQSKPSSINFVDAFAGPWGSTDKKYSDTSFSIAINILEDVRTFLINKNGNTEIETKFFFCEKNKKAIKELQKYSSQYEGLQIKVFSGPFEENLDGIAKLCDGGFTFTFIDPTGWKINSESIFKFLKNLRGEFLLNFMEEPISRHTQYEKVTKSVGSFLANPNWEDEFNKLNPEWNTEEKILYLLKKKAKNMGVTKYMPDFPIQNTRKNRIKMRLILGTNSYKALILFRNVHQKVEWEEIKIRSVAHSKDKNKLIFADDKIIYAEQEKTGIGSPKYKRKAKEHIINFLSNQNPMNFEKISADILEKTPIRLTQINELMKSMKNNNDITYELKGREGFKPDTLIHLGNHSDLFS